MNISSRYILPAFSALVLAAGCENNNAVPDTGRPLEVYGDIVGGGVSADTKSVQDDFGSYLSEPGFTDGDMIGFYSLRDESGDENNGYSNLPLTFVPSENCFRNEDLIVDYPNNFRYTFAYYPYEASNTDDVDIYREDGSVEDILVAGTGTISDGRIYFSFRHAFSMLLIVPGNGFSQSAEDGNNAVIVKLKSGKSARVEKTDASISLAVEDDADAETVFEARRCIDVTFTEGEDVVPVPVCYSVILPCGSEIEYVQMTDDHGTVQYMDPGMAAFESGWRYPINVSMTGTLPVVRNYGILPWTDAEEINLGGTYGIYSADDLENWAIAYNTYTGGDESDAVIESLSRYGEMTEGVWNFCLNADIDCKDLFASSGITAVITSFKDVFDGRNYTLSNLSVPLMERMTAGGTLTDLNMDSPDIVTAGTTPVGAVVMIMDGGTITGCDVTDIRIEAAGPAGAIAGTASAGTITGNVVSGLLLGSSSSPDGITGSRAESVTCTDNISSALIF